jgi:hypothetical protein
MANPCDQIKKDMTTLENKIVSLSTALNNAITQQQKADIQKSALRRNPTPYPKCQVLR